MGARKKSTTTIASRYGRALFSLAKEQNNLAQVEKDLVSILSVWDESEALRHIADSPIIAPAEMNKAVQEILSKLQAGKPLQELCTLLVERRRLRLLPKIGVVYRALVEKERGEVSARVISAVKLNDNQRQEIASTLTKNLKKTVKIETVVDPSIKGGVIVRIGSMMFDDSVKSKLEALRVLNKQAIAAM